MGNKTIKTAIIGGVLCTALAVSVLAGEAKTSPQGHWAQGYVEKLAVHKQVAEVFAGNELNQHITASQLEKLLVHSLDLDIACKFEQATREEVVAKLIQVWALETGQDLNEMVIPMVMVFNDEEQMSQEYRHYVMIAYFNGFIKGRSDGYFAPKDQLTYGEAAVLINRLKSMLEEGKKQPAEQKDGQVMEANFKTEASYKLQDSHVVFSFQLTNVSDQVQQYVFSSGQQFEIVVTDQAGQEVYRYSHDKFFTMALIMGSLQPGEIMEWQEAWDKKDQDGNPVPAGSYKAVITIKAFGEEMVELPMEELTSQLELTI